MFHLNIVDGFIVILLVITIFSYRYKKINVNKYLNSINKKKYTGFDIAKLLLEKNDIKDYYIIKNNRNNNCYDINRKTIKLSKDVFENNSLSSIAVSIFITSQIIMINEKNEKIIHKEKLFPILLFFVFVSLFCIVLSCVLFKTVLFNIGVVILLIILLYEIMMLPMYFQIVNFSIDFLQKNKICSRNELEIIKKILISLAIGTLSYIFTRSFLILYERIKSNYDR